MVRTSAFQAENRSSILLGATKFSRKLQKGKADKAPNRKTSAMDESFLKGIRLFMPELPNFNNHR